MLIRRFKRVVLLLAFSLALPATTLADRGPLAAGPNIGSLEPTDVQQRLTTALSAAQQWGDKKKELSQDIANARTAYWAAYPNGENLAELEAVYAEKLAVKDMYYLLTRAMDRGAAKSKSVDKQLSRVKGMGIAGAADAVDMATGRVDGGMDKASQAMFHAWTDSMFENLGNVTAAVTSPMDVFAPAFGSSSEEYLAYKRHRDFQEFLANSKDVQADLKLKFNHVVLGSGLTDDPESAEKAYTELTRRLGTAAVQSGVDQALVSMASNEGGLSLGTLTNVVSGTPGERLWASMIEQVKSKQGDRQATALVQTAIKDWQFNVKVDSDKAQEKGGISGVLGDFKNPFDKGSSKSSKKESKSSRSSKRK